MGEGIGLIMVCLIISGVCVVWVGFGNGLRCSWWKNVLIILLFDIVLL